MIDNHPIIIYLNKTEIRIKFTIKAGYYFELFMPETMELLGSIKSKITKTKNGENVSHLEIIKVVLVHYSIFINNYQQNSKVLYRLFPINCSVNC